MNEHGTGPRVSDETLVAFIDGELDAEQAREVEARIAADAELAQRFDSLCCGGQGLAEAFDALLERAPLERLGAGLASLPLAQPRAPRRRGLALAAAACLVLGMALDRLLLGGLPLHHEEYFNWRQRVADYMSLYTVQTLDHLPGDPAVHQAQLATVGERLGLALPAPDLALEGAQLRRAQILEYDGIPIAQLTYLDERYGPMALCITRSDGRAAAPQQERREGMNLVYWQDAGHAYLLIGHNPPEALQSMAAGLRQRLGGGGGV
ncbi:Transmembrane transcriptional regulator (anti-sigma factor RsiW) [Pseudomonas delhiensis]|uniref:Transmembrane transcriptional regulator (Anti-sigma factor RsiW) n=1 Tax=Pseudomonas delhiensis TaxID=366289 RepID=A0A239NIB8_9PSED|nr:hypothetical protein [Pseudomonas delhiensis]SDK97353.1 Transmembrane transcriptional regulator (anti-sigma factor RsiW) [Pseudomonas delhiensis]SNT54687.1 Transmembrane transcriptional regulator (anti-sigma factor RsiW) [Pseudomonas delhiensis]